MRSRPASLATYRARSQAAISSSGALPRPGVFVATPMDSVRQSLTGEALCSTANALTASLIFCAVIMTPASGVSPRTTTDSSPPHLFGANKRGDIRKVSVLRFH